MEKVAIASSLPDGFVESVIQSNHPLNILLFCCLTIVTQDAAKTEYFDLRPGCGCKFARQSFQSLPNSAEVCQIIWTTVTNHQTLAGILDEIISLKPPNGLTNRRSTH